VRVQIVLNPTESKRLIAKAIVEMDVFRKAIRDGIVVIHPSSTTYYIFEFVTGQKPEGIWLVGMLCPKGACVEGLTQRVMEEDHYQELSDPANFPFSWVFRKGKLERSEKLSDVLNEMGEGDVYVKGVNAIDDHGYVGVLLASLAGGTIGKVLRAEKQRKFTMIYAGGLEKFIPGSLQKVAKDSGRPNTSDAMGIPCAILPIRGQAVTEVEALNILTGADGIPIAAGGVGGAEGSIMMVVKGNEEQVKQAIQLARDMKDAKLPSIIMPVCRTCHLSGCYYSGKEMDR
jgi:hypothetical protein